jgi:hypothetical protein
MEISDADAIPKNDRLLDMDFCRTIRANGDVFECKCSCMEDRGDWDYYELKCGHKAHTRCLRHWLAARGRLNCPICGDLEEIDRNRWCDTCNEWGHPVSDICLEKQYNQRFYDKIHTALCTNTLSQLKVKFDQCDGEIMDIGSNFRENSGHCKIISASRLTLRELEKMQVNMSRNR